MTVLHISPSDGDCKTCVSLLFAKIALVVRKICTLVFQKTCFIDERGGGEWRKRGRKREEERGEGVSLSGNSAEDIF